MLSPNGLYDDNMRKWLLLSPLGRGEKLPEDRYGFAVWINDVVSSLIEQTESEGWKLHSFQVAQDMGGTSREFLFYKHED